MKNHDNFPAKRQFRAKVALAAAVTVAASLVSCNENTAHKANPDQVVATTTSVDRPTQPSTTREISNPKDELIAQVEYQANNIAYFVNDLFASKDPNIQSDLSKNYDGMTRSVSKFVKNPDGTVGLYTAAVRYSNVSNDNPNPSNAKVVFVSVSRSNITDVGKSSGNSTNSPADNDSSISLFRATDAPGQEWELVKDNKVLNVYSLYTTQPLRGAANPNVDALTFNNLFVEVQEISAQLVKMQQDSGMQPND